MSKAETIYLKEYKAPRFTIKTCDLVFELYEDHTQVTNLMSIKRVDESAKDLVLDSIDLELLEINLDDEKLSNDRYVIEEEHLRVLDVGDEFKNLHGERGVHIGLGGAHNWLVRFAPGPIGIVQEGLGNVGGGEVLGEFALAFNAAKIVSELVAEVFHGVVKAKLPAQQFFG